jgi:signal peptidase I
MSSWHRRSAALAALAALTATLATLGCAQMSRVQGSSMSPTIEDGDRILMTPLVGTPARGDVVGLRYPKDPAKRFVMRIVGLPGERLSIADGIVHIDGAPLDEPYIRDHVRSHETFGRIQLEADEYFVMGDNRRNASDSREWGPIRREHIWAKWGAW